MSHFQLAKMRLKFLFLTASTDTVNLFLCVSSLLWAALLLWPGHTFDRPTYSMMGQLAPEVAWGIAHLIHSLAGLYALFLGRNNRTLFALDPVLGCFLWTTSAIAMCLSVYPPPAAIAPHIIGAFASWWLLVRYREV